MGSKSEAENNCLLNPEGRSEDNVHHLKEASFGMIRAITELSTSNSKETMTNLGFATNLGFNLPYQEDKIKFAPGYSEYISVNNQNEELNLKPKLN